MEEIKKLRERTGAGISDCKKAIDEAAGDIEKAVEILRKKGIAKAAKRGDREANEGVVVVGVNEAGDVGYAIQINSETDFVAKNEQFQQFGVKALELANVNDPKNLEELLALQSGIGSLKEELGSLSGVIGEKLEISRFGRLAGSFVAAYSHLGGRIGSLVALDEAGSLELAGTLAMQVAATSPRYIYPEDVDLAEIEKEKEIGRETLAKEGKPENIIDKILEGKIKKYCEEICLAKQEYIKNDKQKIEELLGDAKISGFIIFSLRGSSTVCEK